MARVGGLERACAKDEREMLGVSSGLIASHTRASRPGGSRQRPRKRRACVASRVPSARPAPAATAFSTAVSKACSYCNRSSSPMAAASRSLARSTASDVLCRFSGTRDMRFCVASSTSATIPSDRLSAPLATPAALRYRLSSTAGSVVGSSACSMVGLAIGSAIGATRVAARDGHFVSRQYRFTSRRSCRAGGALKRCCRAGGVLKRTVLRQDESIEREGQKARHGSKGEQHASARVRMGGRVIN